MNTLLADKPQNNGKIKPSQVIGGAVGWMNEIGFEMETPSVSSVARGVGGLIGDVIGNAIDTVGEAAGVKNEVPKAFEDAFKNEPEYKLDPTKFPSQGSIEFNQVQAKQKEADRKKTFYQALKDDQLRAHQAKERMWFEEEINDIASNISTEEKNELLHYQAGYKDRSIYQKAELRKKIIEQRRKKDQQQKEASIPSPAKKISALEGAFEGASGKVGSGTANFGKGSVQ